MRYVLRAALWCLLGVGLACSVSCSSAKDEDDKSSAAMTVPPSIPLPRGAPQEPVGDLLLESPLDGLDFGPDSVPYPDGWPSSLVFPDEFTLVQAVSGQLEMGTPGFSMNMTYEGTSQEALDALSKYLHEWTAEAESAGSDSLFVSFRGPDEASGIGIFDQVGAQTLILMVLEQ